MPPEDIWSPKFEFGDGTSAASTEPTHTYGEPGRYAVKFTSTEVLGYRSAVQRTITISSGDGPPTSGNSAEHVVVSLLPASIISNGSSTTTATAKVTDANGMPVSGQRIAFFSTDPGERIGLVSELSAGTYSASIISSTTVGSATITATDESVSPSISGHAILTQEESAGTAVRIACLQSALVGCGPPPPILRLNGAVVPRNLPKHAMAPVTVKIGARISTKDGAQPPALREMTMNSYKSGTVNATGLSACSMGQLESNDAAADRRGCRNSIVGTGTAHIEIDSSQQPILVPLTIFNGGVRDQTTTLLIESDIPAATPAQTIATVKLSKTHQGRNGLDAIATIPAIPDQGSLLGFSLKIKRLFRYKGAQQSFAMARCLSGQLNASITTTFSDGVSLAAPLSQPCAPKG